MKIKNETQFQRLFRSSLYVAFDNCLFMKTHGDAYTERGIPDVIGHIDEIFVAFELKMYGGYPSREQKAYMKKLERSGATQIYYGICEAEKNVVWLAPASKPLSYKERMMWAPCPIVGNTIDFSPLKTAISMAKTKIKGG